MTSVDGQRVIDRRPDTLLRTVDEALCRLQTDSWPTSRPLGPEPIMVSTAFTGNCALRSMMSELIIYDCETFGLKALSDEFPGLFRGMIRRRTQLFRCQSRMARPQARQRENAAGVLRD